MKNSAPNQIDRSRILFKIPDFFEFGEILHDRLHAILYHIEELEAKFMLITNIFNREFELLTEMEGKKDADLESLTYAGTTRQRKILENEVPEYYIKALKLQGEKWDQAEWKKKRDKNWAALKNRALTREMEKVETFPFFDRFRKGEFGVEDIQIGTLEDYFANLDNVLQENEYPIVSDYFDISTDKYIGIPLFGAGLFQGIVWILFPDELSKKLDNPTRIRRIMKLFKMEYDNLAMSWDVRGKNITRASFFDEVVKAINPSNEIQNYINVKQYYKISTYYHQERVKQNDAILNQVRTLLDKVRHQHLRTAIITILLDSFAHNISAHSLTTLSHWFRERAEYQDEMGRAIIETLGRDKNNPIINYTKKFPNRTLSKELFPLFKFLLEKGAFWSGITRQTNFTGKVISLYEVLWSDFVNNPLYLGTIANTEDVRKLHLNITIYEQEDRPEGENFKNKKTVKTTSDGTLLDGTFAVVNLDDFDQILNATDNTRSLFVEEGELYEELSKELKSFNAFFPGGVIGKHAFFTLLENEIRNVKHYRGEVLKAIQKEGLILNISIHTRPVDSEAKERSPRPELYKIGVWLKHPVKLEEGLLIRRIEGLDSDIVTDNTFQPKLGGNYQDKICGSVLMMSAFDQVQSEESAIGKIYYPWIKTASYLIREQESGVFEEFEVSHRKYREANKAAFTALFEPEAGLGYLKKYFHIWKGEEILDIVNTVASLRNPALDSRARYRFIYLPENSQAQHYNLKSSGLIRIISAEALPTSLEEAYHLWLPRWLKKNEEDYVIDFLEGATRVGRVTYKGRTIQFENESEIEDADWDDEQYAIYKAIPNRMQIAVEHGSSLTAAADKFNYRSHGEMITKFCEGKPMNQLKAMSTIRCFELFESLISRICIFDRRIYNRLYNGRGAAENERHQIDDKKLALQIARLQLYRDHLHLNFQNELLDHFESVRSQDFLAYHFVVLHLSFIEGMIGKNGQKYGEEGIIDFIDEHILQGRSPKSIGDDFVLIITTGRGRMAWWDKVKENPIYMRFVTFRPIESIIGAVENALQKPDDIDLKYNLTKLFFGS